VIDPLFIVGHDAAFVHLGARAPRQQWSSFDVSLADASTGSAALFVTSVWNRHSKKDELGRTVLGDLAVCRDVNSGSLWYRFDRPPCDTSRENWKTHWKRFRLAVEFGVPIKGFLKDAVSKRASTVCVFDCVNILPTSTYGGAWLQLATSYHGALETRPIDINQLVGKPTKLHTVWEPDERAEIELSEAMARTSEERRLRLAKASPFPKRRTVVTSVFERNNDVIAEVLYQAKGICQGCGAKAPFYRRSNNAPYLEVHHRVRLADGGEDTVENAIALCPNCHRQRHYG
jgi:5-methylcytosine-specific restriction endonuclease McrA